MTIFAVVFLGCLLLPRTINAHEIRPAIVELNYISSEAGTNDGRISINMVVNLESLIAGIGPEHDNTDTAENADFYQELRAMEQAPLLAEFERFQNQFVSAIQLSTADNTAFPLTIVSMDIPQVDDLSVPRDTKIVLQANLPREVVALQWRWSQQYGEAIIRANSDSADLEYAALLSPGQQSDLIQFTQQIKQSAWQVLKNYIVVGFEHILPKGLDHILFVVGLFLLTSKWRALALQITVFTVAHSITLALGARGLVPFSASIVEPLIALSIVFVCVENLLTYSLSKWRIVMIFAFGLLHGLGFASVLSEVGLNNSHFVVALLGFNIGVELGQLLIVALCFLAIGFWFGNKTYYRRFITKPASLIIGLIGLYWFYQRVAL